MEKWEMKWDPNTRKTCPGTGYQTGPGTKLFKIAERFKIGSFFKKQIVNLHDIRALNAARELIPQVDLWA